MCIEEHERRSVRNSNVWPKLRTYKEWFRLQILSEKLASKTNKQHTPQLDVYFSGGFLTFVYGSLSSALCPVERSTNISTYIKQVNDKVWKPEWHPSKQIHWIHWSVQKHFHSFLLSEERKFDWLIIPVTAMFNHIKLNNIIAHTWLFIQQYKLHQAGKNNG